MNINTILDHTITNMSLLSVSQQSIILNFLNILTQSMFNKETQLLTLSANFASDLIQMFKESVKSFIFVSDQKHSADFCLKTLK